MATVYPTCIIPIGVLCYPDGRVYKGTFEDDKMHGRGEYVHADGSRYEGTSRGLPSGEFAQGLKHGQGTYTWKDGRIYVGAFENGKQHGLGKYTSKGATKAGRWENGKIQEWLEPPKSIVST
jgi:hypothetical protein